MQPEVQEEALWLRQIAAGDRDAFEKLYRTCQGRLFGYLFRVAQDRGAAEELTNDVMLEVWKSAGRFRGESKVSTWIFGIAHHRVLNYLRQRRPETVDMDAMSAMSAVADPAEGPEQDAMRRDLRANIGAALRRLPPEQREIVELTFYQGCSYEEISAIARCPVNTVKTRMFHAKRKLQEILERTGI